jgi:hypothetical protein
MGRPEEVRKDWEIRISAVAILTSVRVLILGLGVGADSISYSHRFVGDSLLFPSLAWP